MEVIKKYECLYNEFYFRNKGSTVARTTEKKILSCRSRYCTRLSNVFAFFSPVFSVISKQQAEMFSAE